MAVDQYDALLEFLKPFTKGIEGYLGVTIADRDTSAKATVKTNKKWSWLNNLYPEVADGEINLPYEALGGDMELEFYFTPAVLKEPSRLQSKFQASNVIWIDFDELVDWESFDPVPSIVVQTSLTKHHCYWIVEDQITDPNEMRYWCTRLLEYFSEDGEGDPSGVDATQLLKLPIGKNLKLMSRTEDGSAFQPKVVKFDPELKYPESAFEHIPEPTSPVDAVVDTEGIGDAPAIDMDLSWSDYAHQHNVPDDIMKKLYKLSAGGEEKRSGALYSLIKSLTQFLEGRASDIFEVLYRSPNDKFTADHGLVKGGNYLWRDISRVVAKGQREKATKGGQRVNAIMKDKDLDFREKGIKVADLVLGELYETGTFLQTAEGYPYYADTQKGVTRLLGIDTGFGTGFASMVIRRFGINAGVDRGVLSGILYEAIAKCKDLPRLTFHTFAHYDTDKQLCYVDAYNGSMYVLNGKTVVSQPYGYDDVYFYPHEGEAFPTSFEYSEGYTPGGLDALIFDGPNYTTKDINTSRKELRHILKTWVASFFFPSVMQTKPIVCIHGAADSGKTSLFQNLSIMFSGDSSYSVTEIPKDPKEFNLQATTSPYIFYDNVEANNKVTQEKLAQVATGYTMKIRKLYTTNEMISTKARAFVGITTRTLSRIQDDVAERYILVPVHPFNTNKTTRRPMSAILREVMTNRDALWSEMLDFVNKIIAKFRKGRTEATASTIRMADYGSLLELTCEIQGVSFSNAQEFIRTMQSEILKENEPLFEALAAVAEALDKEAITFSNAELYKKLTTINRKVKVKYGSSAKFLKEMRRYSENDQFGRAGLNIEVFSSGNNNKIRIHRALPPKDD